VAKYQVQVGLNYDHQPDNSERRAEAGDVVNALPTGSTAWLANAGLIQASAATLSDVVRVTTTTES